MSTMLIANNETRESGSFCGDQLCSLKTAYLFAEHAPPDVDKFVMSVSPGNEMAFLWQKFVDKYNIELVHDNWNPGDWTARWNAWDRWRVERRITMDDGRVQLFTQYRELYLRIHGSQRQQVLCGSERGYGRRNIYGYWFCGQENTPDELPPSNDWFDDSLVYHPPHQPTRDVYISPLAKTQGNVTFTFEFWADVVHKLIDAGLTVTVGHHGWFCEDLNGHPLYKKHWGTHEEWINQICQHKIVACGNTGTGWLACACGVPMITMEPPNSIMADHRYRECGLRNIVEVVDVPDSDYVARRIINQVRRVLVMTTGCYDILHAGHVRHLEKSRSLGTKLIVALNSDESVRRLKGPTRPINSQGQRKAVLEALRCVDEVRIFDGDNAIPLIEELKPDVLTNGFGYTADIVVGRDLVEEYGGRVEVTYGGDASDEPSTTKIAKRLLRVGDVIEACRIGSTYSSNPFEKLKVMADECASVVNFSGDIADLGSGRGGSAFVLRHIAPTKKLYIFDTWEGTPYSDPLCHHKQGEWAVPMESCQQLIGNGVLTNYLQGVFPNTSAGLEYNEFCFVYIDMDTYQATRDAIEFFWPRLIRGGKMAFDDYGWEPCAGVKKAVDEMFPPDESDRYVHCVAGVAKRRVVESLFTCVLEKR